MPDSSHHLARGILMNAGALSLIGVLHKGAGLFIAILVARFLGPDSMGLFALLYSAALLTQIFVTLGMSESLVRDVAARPDLANAFYRFATGAVALTSVPAMLVLALIAILFVDGEVERRSLLVIAAGTPLSGAYGVAQAVLQGMERVLLLTWVSFAGRVLSLAGLAWAFHEGAGVEFAFVSTMLFNIVCLIPFHAVIRRHSNDPGFRLPRKQLFGRALPFALNRGVRELNLRLPSLVLPAVSGLVAAGIFDAANRIRNSVEMVVTAGITGLTPAFARNFTSETAERIELVGYSIKYMCIVTSILATVIVVLADWIIRLLFGSEFAGAALSMQILAWAQVIHAADAVLQQAMLSQDHTYAAVRNGVLVLVVQLLLVIGLAVTAGLAGAAAGVLLSSILALVLNLGFTTRNIVAISVTRFVGMPLAAVCVVASLLLLFDDASLFMRAVVAIGGWAVAMTAFRVLPGEELRFAVRLVSSGRWKRSGDP